MDMLQICTYVCVINGTKAANPCTRDCLQSLLSYISWSAFSVYTPMYAHIQLSHVLSAYDASSQNTKYVARWAGGSVRHHGGSTRRVGVVVLD